MKGPLLFLVSLAACGVVSNSQAVTFKFYALSSSGSAPFVPPGELFPVPGSGTSFSNDWVGDPGLTYLVDGLGVTATATYDDPINGTVEAVAVQDRESGWTDTLGAGLGVYKPYVTPNPPNLSDDNVDLGELLKLTSRLRSRLAASFFERTVTTLRIGPIRRPSYSMAFRPLCPKALDTSTAVGRARCLPSPILAACPIRKEADRARISMSPAS